MSAIQDLAPYIEEFQPTVKRTKETQHFTTARLAKESGVSESTLTKFLSGASNDPKLYTSVALCKTLQLSVDRLFGLPIPTDSTNEDLQQRVHELELENARLLGKNEAFSDHAKQAKSSSIILSVLSALLVVALIVYLVFDSTIHDMGVIQGGKPTSHGWLVIGLVFAAAVLITFLLVRTLRRK